MLRAHLVAALLCCHAHAFCAQDLLTVLSLASIFSGPIWVTYASWVETTAAAFALTSALAIGIVHIRDPNRDSFPTKTHVSQGTIAATAILILVAEVTSTSNASSAISIGVSIGLAAIIQLLQALQKPKEKGA